MTKIDFRSDNGDLEFSADFPSSWEEMTASQVQYVFQQYDRCLCGKVSPLQMNLLVLYNILGLERRIPSSKIASDSSICANLYRLCEQCLDFLFVKEDDGQMPRLSFNSVQNPLPVVRGGKARVLLTGPASLLQDVTFGEFRRASAALNAFFESGTASDLDECIAHLYRRRAARPNRAGRHVKPFDQNTFDNDVQIVSTLAGWQKNLIMMWFSACLGYLQTGTLVMNGETVDFGKLFGKDEKGSGPAFTWNDLLVQIARENTIGNIDRVDEESLFTILSIMWTNYKENLRYEKASATPRS